MVKNCKIISAYFGPRRKYPNGIDETIKYWDERIISKELSVDPGVDMDTIIVNHDYGNEIVKNYLAGLNGTKTKRGIIKVINRSWDDGVGGSYKSFSEGYETLMDEYDNWFFTEDTVIPILDSYYKIALNQLNSDEKLAFICCLRVGGINHENKHCDGGCGVTNSKYLKILFNKFNELPHSKLPMNNSIQKGIIDNDLKILKKNSEVKTKGGSWYHDFCHNGEIRFTNEFVNCGFKIRNLELEDKVIKWRDLKV